MKSLIIFLDDKYDNYPLSKLTSGKSWGENCINDRRPSLYNLITSERKNEILSLSKENYEMIKKKFPDDVEKCDSKSNPVLIFIEWNGSYSVPRPRRAQP